VAQLSGCRWHICCIFLLMSRVLRAASLIWSVATLTLFATEFPAAQTRSQTLTASEAKAHIGSTTTVCGKVVTPRYATSTRGQPTFLNFDKPYPNQEFTVVIWGSDRTKFGAPELVYSNQIICVTGKIEEYRGGAEIVASNPSQISVRELPLETQSPDGRSASAAGPPNGATAQCRDGTFSFSRSRSGTCSHHGGVARWLGGRTQRLALFSPAKKAE